MSCPRIPSRRRRSTSCMMSFPSCRNLYANARLRSVWSVSIANGLPPAAASRSARSSPKSARSTTSSAASLMSCVTLTGSPRSAARCHFAASVHGRRLDVRHPRRDDLAMERGLDQLALHAPLVAFARHDAVAEQDRDALDADALGEVVVAVDEHVPDVVGVRQHPDVARERRRMRAVRVAVPREEVRQRRQRVGLERDVEGRGGERRERSRVQCRVHLVVPCRIFAGCAMRGAAGTANLAAMLQCGSGAAIISPLCCFEIPSRQEHDNGDRPHSLVSSVSATLSEPPAL